MMHKYLMILMGICLLPLSAIAESLTVAAAANVQFTLEELKAEFVKESGIEVKTVIGASGKLTSQIENGAPFDIFMSADMDYPQRLYTEGLTLEKPKVYAYGYLVLWTLTDADLSKGLVGLSDSAIKRIAIASPKSAPYGREAVNAMRNSNLYSDIASKLVYGENIAQANQFITTKAADVGFTAKSVVLAPNMKDKGTWIEVDHQLYEPIAQGVVILKYASKYNSVEAQKFYEFLFSPTAQEIFKKYGYTTP